jgi:dihydroorotate dehydrogenase (NAD+) catalytic subunit
LANIGVEAFIKDKLPCLRTLKLPVIVNVAGFAIDDYVETARKVSDQQGIAGIELNISCPNVKKGGMEFGVEPGPAEEITSRVKAVVKQPLMVKLSPNVTDIAAMAQAVKNGGADSVAVINTYVGMVIDIERRKPVLKNGVGGLSGPAIRPLAVRCVWRVRKKVDIPILGLGGIMDGNDAMQFILAGASAVAVGTGTFLDPNAGARVTAGMADYLTKSGAGSLKELVGLAHQAAA